MMAGPLFLMASWLLRPATSFTLLKSPSCRNSISSSISSSSSSRSSKSRLFSSVAVQNGISRLAAFQSLLTTHGAPGSLGCHEPNDLVPLTTKEEPELLLALESSMAANLHPHLFPVAKSTKTGHYICGLRRASDTSSDGPWPIVESAPGARGMRLLALHSEHLMRRMAAENDVEGGNHDIIKTYNAKLGQGIVKDAQFDIPYTIGSVAKLGYGPEKYILLKVGPFPDLYESMALSHANKGDEASSLIAAEASNGKFSGFGSTFRFYAKLLNSFPNRDDETRDAARICWRLPLPSMGMTDEDFRDVAVLGKIATVNDSMEKVLENMQAYYEKIRQHEQDDPGSSGGKTPEQSAIEEANYLLDTVALKPSCNWSEIRPKLGEIYASAGREDMAAFVDPSRVV